MKTLGYYNGKIDELENMYVPMLDRACYFGDGIYDASYSYNYRIFALDEHIERFFDGLARVDIKLNISKQMLYELLSELTKKMDTHENFVYWQASRGSGIRNHSYDDLIGNLWVMIKPMHIVDMSQKIKLISSQDIRYELCDIKTLNLLPSVLYSQKAYTNNVFECVLHRNGRVTECAHSNIHYLKDGILYTPPTDRFILNGIARRHLIKACNNLGIDVRVQEFDMTSLMASDEVIVTSSGSLCLQVQSIDDIPVGGKDNKNIKKLQKYLLEEFLSSTSNER